jgi:hypothetical protein
MAVTYDPAVLAQHAEKLYSQARGVAVTTALRWGAVFGLIGFIAIHVVNARGPVEAIPLGSGGLGALLGFFSGWEKAFALRLEAQRALCALQTEINTRPKG